MNWGKWIVLSFVLFTLFIGTLVVVCVREDISLVSPDYYQQELVFQDQIERIRNTEMLKGKPVIQLLNQALVVQFNQSQSIDGGNLLLFRPSDNHYDKSYALPSHGEDVQQFDIRNLPLGMYKARLQWKMQGKEYYLEEVINL